MMTSLLTGAAAAAVSTLVLTPAVRRLAFRSAYLDVPNDRSSHRQPTPKTGGYAILAGVAVGVWTTGVWRAGNVAVILGGVLLLTVVAFVDDRRPLPMLFRLVLQAGIAALVVWGLRETSAPAGDAAFGNGWIAALVALVWIVGLINTYNFMDGLNGIAGGAAVVTGAVLAELALLRGDLPAAVLAISVAAAVAGFLPFNIPGLIFMGDAGSTALGLVFGALVLDAARAGGVPVAATLPLVPFVLDAGTTRLNRALRGERFWLPHREHYYQRLQQAGWSHTAVAGLYSALTIATGSVALVFDRLATGQRVAALAAVLIGHALIFSAIQRRWPGRATTEATGIDSHGR
jgi:Fuc2NAc and GlcNAc transferase